MRKHSLLYIGFGLVILLWALNFIALAFYFYWTLGWYDYMMHFLGGLTIGVLIIWFFKLSGERSWKLFLASFVPLMLIGVGWEIWEYANSLTFSTEDYRIDTVHDLLMDAVGAASAYWLTTSRTRELS